MPWPEQAIEARDTAVTELVRIVNLSIALNDLACEGQIYSEAVSSIATYLNDAGGVGELVLQREYGGIERWPKAANAAKLTALAVFEKAQVYAAVLRRVERQPSGLRQRLIQMAAELNTDAHESLRYMRECGAVIDTRKLRR